MFEDSQDLNDENEEDTSGFINIDRPVNQDTFEDAPKYVCNFIFRNSTVPNMFADLTEKELEEVKTYFTMGIHRENANKILCIKEYTFINLNDVVAIQTLSEKEVRSIEARHNIMQNAPSTFKLN